MLHHVMFDVDGTLVQSCEFDTACYLAAIESVLSQKIETDWSTYRNATDSGVLSELLERMGIRDDLDGIHRSVREAFVTNVKEHLKQTPAMPVPGAPAFIEYLKADKNVTVSIATGGWKDSALLKLLSAGIDIGSIPMASGDDDISRVGIMRCALNRAGVTPGESVYFGDAIWDKMACEALGVRFVLVGHKIDHKPQVADYHDMALALKCIGL